MSYSSSEMSFFNKLKQISINEQTLALPNNKKGESGNLNYIFNSIFIHHLL
jgi:hypothetical protein